jgi:hypothetical protein
LSELPTGPKVSLASYRERYEPEYVENAPQPEGMALPAGCIRRLQLPQATCEVSCAGRQRDGGCCADLVRDRASWQFVIDKDGYWQLIS